MWWFGTVEVFSSFGGCIFPPGVVMPCRKFWLEGEWVPEVSNGLQKLGNWNELIRRPTRARSHPQRASLATRCLSAE